ncbi:MAG: pseudouridine synthase [Anaerolineales bacterium]|nr:pseudouridine synthase [Anaerolineales bacterium]
MQERLQKLLAQAGYGSRRACEEFIIAGRVRVNGEVATLGQKADLLFDKVTLDGNALPKVESMTYIALYKPRNVISASEDQERQTVRDLIPVEGHLYPVGRLDYDSEGLILMTNDGDLTNKLTHPKFGHEKEYRVLLARKPEEKQLATWRRGIILEDGYHTQPCDVVFVSNSGKGAWVRVVMGEGRKRQIRETGRLLGLPVVKIIRMRIGSLRLGSLKPRMWRYLTESEVAELKGEKKAEAGASSAKASNTLGKTWTKRAGPRNAKDKKPWPKDEALKKPADRKSWTKKDGERNQTAKKPWVKNDGDKKPFERKPWSKKDEGQKSTDRKAWPRKDGEKKPFRKPVERRPNKK